MNETKQNSYGRTAWFYERAAYVYSGGQIRASKKWQLQCLASGQKILYVGAGNGEDVIMAAKKGLFVTVVELSHEMINSLKNKLERLSLSAKVTLICGDAYEHKPNELYDAVAANYFLNVFSEQIMQKMLAHLATLIKPDGMLFVADFAPPVENPLIRFFQKIYYFLAVAAFHLIAKNSFHPLYDYPAYLDKLGLRLCKEQRFRLFGIGPKWYWAMKVVKR